MCTPTYVPCACVWEPALVVFVFPSLHPGPIIRGQQWFITMFSFALQLATCFFAPLWLPVYLSQSLITSTSAAFFVCFSFSVPLYDFHALQPIWTSLNYVHYRLVNPATQHCKNSFLPSHPQFSVYVCLGESEGCNLGVLCSKTHLRLYDLWCRQNEYLESAPPPL